MSFKLFSHCAVDGVNKRVREKMDAKDQIKFLRLDMQTYQLCLPCWTLVRNHKHIHLRLLYTKQQMINFNSTQQMIIFKSSRVQCSVTHRPYNWYHSSRHCRYTRRLHCCNCYHRLHNRKSGYSWHPMFRQNNLERQSEVHTHAQLDNQLPFN